MRAKKCGVKKDSFSLRAVLEKKVKRVKEEQMPDVYTISPEILHLAQDVCAVPLTFIVKISIQVSIVPHCWKVAKCLPLHKKKERPPLQIIAQSQYYGAHQKSWRRL
jgi:hypothetical protein